MFSLLCCPRKWCEVFQSMCLYVCLCVCPSVRSHISTATSQDFTKFSVHVTRGHDSVLLWPQCNALRIFRFADDVTFSHRLIGQMQIQAWSLRRSELFTVTRQVAPPDCAPESKSALVGFYRATQRSYASAVLGVVILSVRPSVRPSHACFVTNPKNLPAIFLYRIKGQSF